MYPPFMNFTYYHGTYPFFFCHSLSILAHSHQDALFLKLIMPLEVEVVKQRNHHAKKIQEKLYQTLKLLCCQVSPCALGRKSQVMDFPLYQKNSMKVINLLTTTDVWADWEWCSLLWVHLWHLFTDVESGILWVHALAIISEVWWFDWYPFQSTMHMVKT